MLSPAEWHERNHGFRDQSPPPMDECRRCQRSVIRCRGKVSYITAEDAYAAALMLNVQRGPGSLVRSYLCRHCLKRHLTGRMSKTQNKRAEKHRRKTLRPAGSTL